ncbi:MAG: carbohydrate ABC transporter permease [Firmicutes bacterium]|nr:carbohydrate ABC transporter permease [Bacillota bacterium]MDH7495899.1 carbohydrate ABC transporter permease [Bacillota bacterium]
MRRVLSAVALMALAAAFALPIMWLVTAPFNAKPSLALSLTKPTLENFYGVFKNPAAVTGLKNSLVLSTSTMLVATIAATMAAYAFSRACFRGRETILYILILLSSVVSGVSAMVPLYVLMQSLGLLDTHLGVILVYVGGLLPTNMFIMKDFVDSIPRSYEEAALVDGSTPAQVLANIAFPLCRPGMAVIAVLIFVNTWSNFLVPFILLRSPSKAPASVAIYSFFNEVGIPILGLIAAYSFIYTIPVVTLYIIVNRKFGFRFYGGIKS